VGAVWALGFMALVGLAGAIGLFSQGWRARRGVIVSGEIVGVQAGRMRGASAGGPGPWYTRTHAPVVEFSDANGQSHRVTAGLSGTRRPRIGDTVQVSYQPADPDRAIVLELPGQAPAKWVFLVVGLACAAGAVLVALH
jgi:uncharacterized protein DUF3592